MSEEERQQPAPHLSGQEWLELLGAGIVEVEGRLPWSSNYSFLVSVRAGGSVARAVYKPGRGERALHDFGPDLYRREVAAYELSAAFGIDIVPETVLRSDGPLGPGSLQRFVEADFEEHYFTLVTDERHHARLRELAAFDVLCNNADRKSGHVLVDDEEQLWAIDNGLSFHEQRKLRTVIWDFAGEPVPDRLVEASESLLKEGVPAVLSRLIDGSEVAALKKRARHLVEKGTLPEPGDDYRSYPWPLV